MKSAQVHVKDVPQTLYAEVERVAKERDRNRNDVICEALAARFRAPYESSGYPYREASGSDQWMLRMSHELHAAIKAAADEATLPGRRIAVSRLIISTLQAHFGLPVDSPRKRSNQFKMTPEQVHEARARFEAGESIRSLARRYDVTRPTISRAIGI
jgi:hypothetical protein